MKVMKAKIEGRNGNQRNNKKKKKNKRNENQAKKNGSGENERQPAAKIENI